MSFNCKYCQSGSVIKYGTYKGVQLYYCKDCGSKFKDDDTLFHMKTPANQVSSALNMYYERMSLTLSARSAAIPVAGEAPDKCSICSTPGSKFKKVG